MRVFAVPLMTMSAHYDWGLVGHDGSGLAQYSFSFQSVAEDQAIVERTIRADCERRGWVFEGFRDPSGKHETPGAVR